MTLETISTPSDFERQMLDWPYSHTVWLAETFLTRNVAASQQVVDRRCEVFADSITRDPRSCPIQKGQRPVSLVRLRPDHDDPLGRERVERGPTARREIPVVDDQEVGIEPGEAHCEQLIRLGLRNSAAVTAAQQLPGEAPHASVLNGHENQWARVAARARFVFNSCSDLHAITSVSPDPAPSGRSGHPGRLRNDGAACYGVLDDGLAVHGPQPMGFRACRVHQDGSSTLCSKCCPIPQRRGTATWSNDWRSSPLHPRCIRNRAHPGRKTDHVRVRRDERPIAESCREADEIVESRRIATRIWISVGLAAAVTLIGLVAFWPHSSRHTSSDVDLFAEAPIKAEVVDVTTAPCTGTTEADKAPCNFVGLRFPGHDTPTPIVPRGGGQPTSFAGPTIEQPVSAIGGLHLGDDIYVNMTVLADGTASFSFYDYQRATPMWILAIAFIGAVLILGRWRGLGAIAGLVASLAIIVKFLLPSILDGNSPVMVAIVASSVIAFIALYLAHGVNLQTSVALLGTFASLAVTALLALLFVGWSNLTGLADESALYLTSLGVNVDLQGIVLAGFVIGALGVLDDVTVTQVSAVAELHAAQPALSPRQLYRSAVTIGRDHISSTVNTLFLAYAGAALPLLLLFTQANQSVGSLAGREVIATEIIRSLVGSIGLVSAVPITTWLAVTALHASPALTGHHQPNPNESNPPEVELRT